MSNVLQDSADWLGAQLKTIAPRTVAIAQGSRTLADVTAVMSQHNYEVANEQGFLTLVRAYDWTFVAADLGTLELREGDEIRETASGSVVGRYEVMPIGEKPGVEDLDSSGVLVLAHTRKVS